MVNEFDVLAEAGAQFAAIAAPLILKWIAENPYKKDVIINNKQFDPEEKLWDFYQNKMPKELAPKFSPFDTNLLSTFSGCLWGKLLEENPYIRKVEAKIQVILHPPPHNIHTSVNLVRIRERKAAIIPIRNVGGIEKKKKIVKEKKKV